MVSNFLPFPLILGLLSLLEGLTTGCPSGKFGTNCQYSCHCQRSAQCDAKTGACPAACADDWYGEYCQLGNAAKGRPTKQISSYTTFTRSSLAVDGNIDNKLDTCTQTRENEYQPWWRVDLGAQFVLFKVKLYNRNCEEACGKRLQNFKIWMSNTDYPNPKEGNLCNDHPGIVPSAKVVDISCLRPAKGRYLFIKIMALGTLSLCEVKTWAYRYRDSCPAGFYGPDCNNRCQCASDVPCEVASGKCPPGCNQRFTGPYCNIEIPTASKVGVAADTFMVVRIPVIPAHDSVPDYGQIQRYHLLYKANDGSLRWQEHKDDLTVWRTGRTSFTVNVTGLLGHTEYSFKVTVEYRGATGQLIWSRPGPVTNLWTRCGVPEEGPSIISIKPATNLPNRTTITIKEIPKDKWNCATITHYEVHYKLAGRKAAAWSTYETSSSVALIKGLQIKANYSFIVAVVNSGGMRKNGSMAFFIIPEGYKFDPIILGIGITCAILVVIVIVIGVLVYRLVRKRRKRQADLDPDESEPTIVPLSLIMPDGNDDKLTDSVRHLLPRRKENIIHSEIYENYDVKSKAFYDMPVADLLSIVMAKKSNRAIELRAEFKTFPERLTDAHTIATTKMNLKKNRFRNIVPYDHTRVVLEPTDGVPFSDYINASYVDGYDKQRKFIAAQGPLTSTVNDFWRLIWQEKCPIIAMVTNYVEMGKPKCARYLPTNSQRLEVYGDISVTLINESRLPNFTITTVEAQKAGEKRQIQHFHFTTWPDHGAPKFASSMVEYWRRVTAAAREEGEATTLVHCSAGVGRTGTFLAIDYLFHQGQADSKVNAHECILEMRKYRTNMVQTIDQYIFIHDALVEYFCVGQTTIMCSEFLDEYRKISSADDPSRKSKVQEQHELLSMFDTFHPEKHYSDARSPQNVSKNRSAATLPDNSCWARLSTPMEGRNNYINAVNVDGFTSKKEFIVTQFPLPSTVVDFWRLVDDHEIDTIVTMEPLLEGEHQFWPSPGHYLKFGPIQIKCTTSNDSSPDFTVTDFTIRHKSSVENDSPIKKEVRQYHFKPWLPHSMVPSDALAVVNLLSEVVMRRERGGSGPVLVNCLDGASHSGLFCAALCAVEKVKFEQAVDIFELSRLVRVNRPQFLQYFEQYQFLHDVMVTYLHGFETYANYV